jgi:hypothetical protein
VSIATNELVDAAALLVLEQAVAAGADFRFARCRDGNGTLTHLFFSEDLFDLARAKAICGKCRLAESCLQGALDRQEPWGVWGGQLLVNGEVIVNKRPRGRPPQSPRPELVVDEVPLPPAYLSA